MEILSALGVDSSVGLQFIIFLVAFLVLQSLVFKPYITAYNERDSRTSGQSKSAENTFLEVNKLREEYTKKYQAHNERIQNIYAESKKQGESYFSELMASVRLESTKKVEINRLEISNQISAAKSVIAQEAKSLSSQITKKIIGREIQ